MGESDQTEHRGVLGYQEYSISSSGCLLPSENISCLQLGFMHFSICKLYINTLKSLLKGDQDILRASCTILFISDLNFFFVYIRMTLKHICLFDFQQIQMNSIDIYQE